MRAQLCRGGSGRVPLLPWVSLEYLSLIDALTDPAFPDWPAKPRLLPDRPAEIDLIRRGERAGTGAYCPAERCARKRGADERSANQTYARADAGTAERPVAGAV